MPNHKDTEPRKYLYLNIHWNFENQSGIYEDDYSSELDTSREKLEEAAEFMWTEGNFACDCNRSRFFGLGDWDCGDKIQVTKLDFLGVHIVQGRTKESDPNAKP